MAVDFFLKLDGVKGEVQTTQQKGQIQLLTFAWGVANQSSAAVGTGSGAGKANFLAITVTKATDSASTPIFNDCCAGTHIATGKISAVKAGANGQPYLELDLTEVFVTGYQLNAVNEIPTETVTLSYKSVQLTYFTQNESGGLTANAPGGWNISQNKAV